LRIQENEKSRVDTSVSKNFFAIDMEDFEGQKQEQVSEGNLSNVFNLEGEDYSQRYKKKVKDPRGKVKQY
jgi:hypothetical protein